MPTYKLSLSGAPVDAETGWYVQDEADSLVSLMRSSFLISNTDVIFVMEKDGLYANVVTPGKYDPQYNNEYVNRCIARIKESFDLSFHMTLISDYPAPLLAGIEQPSAFILHYNSFGPVHSFDDYATIPGYLFPLQQDILWWGSDYEAIYRLWSRGDIDEDKQYQYLSDINSPLSQKGLEICRRIEARTGRDCYYALFDQQRSTCPSCQREFEVLPEMLFTEFTVICTPCKILSKIDS